MNGEARFGAPWGRALWIMSAIATAILVIVGGNIASQALDSRSPFLGLVALLVAGILIGPALFTVRGYVVTPETITVLRPIGRFGLPPLSTLRWARVEPKAMRRSLRVFGNGGLYAFSGYFRNRKLGVYRAWVTDLNRTVLLGFPERTIVLSPDNPEEFVRVVCSTRGGSGDFSP